MIFFVGSIPLDMDFKDFGQGDCKFLQIGKTWDLPKTNSCIENLPSTQGQFFKFKK